MRVKLNYSIGNVRGRFPGELFPPVMHPYPQLQHIVEPWWAQHRQRDRTNNNFTRATNRLIKRCHLKSRRYDTEAYLLVRRNSRHYEYNSVKDPSFPPQFSDFVSVCTDYLVSLLALQAQAYQVPI